MKTHSHEIVLCMGSSCFPRGNNHTAEWLMGHVQAHQLGEAIQVTGTLCQNRCKQGPNIMVDGACHCGMDIDELAELMEQWER